MRESTRERPARLTPVIRQAEDSVPLLVWIAQYAELVADLEGIPAAVVPPKAVA